MCCCFLHFSSGHCGEGVCNRWGSKYKVSYIVCFNCFLKSLVVNLQCGGVVWWSSGLTNWSTKYDPMNKRTQLQEYHTKNTIQSIPSYKYFKWKARDPHTYKVVQKKQHTFTKFMPIMSSTGVQSLSCHVNPYPGLECYQNNSSWITASYTRHKLLPKLLTVPCIKSQR